MIQFAKATRKALKGRIAIDGPSGSGKTFTALRMAFTMVAPGKRVVVISSESGAVEKYVGLAPDGVTWDFDIGFLPDFSPDTYTKSILAAGKAGYDVIVIDSLSHAWAGEGGALELVDRAASKSQGGSGNTYFAWRDITPMHNRMLEAIVRSPAHIIGTMRSKTEYVIENVNGKQVPRKVGMSPIQRAGMEYEFDLYCSMNLDHICAVSKTRCPALDAKMEVKPGAEFIAPFVGWLAEGAAVPEGYYSADADDLKALHAAEQAEKSPETKAAEAAEKHRAALRAGLAGGGSSAATAAPVVQQQQPAAEMVNQSTKDRIVAAFKASGKSRDEFAALLKKRGATALGELTQADALQVEGELLSTTNQAGTARVEIAEKPAVVEAKPEVAAPVVAETSPSPQAASEASVAAPAAEQQQQQQPAADQPTVTPPTTTVESTGPKIDAINLAAIQKLSKDIPQPLWPMNERKAYLQARGAKTFNEISNQDAVKLIGELNGRLAKASAGAGSAA